MDTDAAELYVDGTLVHSWTYSDGGGSTIGSFDFFPAGSPGGTGVYYIDNMDFCDMTDAPTGCGVIADPTSPNTQVTGLCPGLNQFVWTFTNNGNCAQSDTVDIIYGGDVTIASAGPDQVVCEDDIVTMQGNAAGVGTGTWSVMAGTGTFADVNDPTTEVTGFSLGYNQYRWTMNNGACDSWDEMDLDVEELPTEADAGEDIYVCVSDPIVPVAGNNPTVGTGLWSLISGAGQFVDPTSAATNIINLEPGENVYAWTISNGTCGSSVDLISVFVATGPVVLEASDYTCDGEGGAEVTLTVGGGIGDSHDIEVVINGRSIITTVTNGTLTFTVFDGDEWSATATTIGDCTSDTIGDTFDNSAEGDCAVTCATVPAVNGGFDYNSNNNGSATVSTSPSQGLSGHLGLPYDIVYTVNGESNSTTVLSGETFSFDVVHGDVWSVVVTDAIGCSSDSADGIADELSGMIIPNMITPNDDGINDDWQLPGILQGSDVSIFNRWGQMVSEIASYSNGSAFNGVVDGDPLPDGTYYYVIEFSINGETEIEKGTITIIR